MEIVYAAWAILLFIVGYIVRKGVKERQELGDDDTKNYITMAKWEKLNRDTDEKVDALYKHLGLRIRTIPLHITPEHKEVVKIEPLSSLSGLTIAPLGVTNVPLSGSTTLGSSILNAKPAPKSTKKRG